MGAPTLSTPKPLSHTPRSAVRTDWSTPSTLSQVTVFCDLDGPLIDVCQRYYKTYQLALTETQAHFQCRGYCLSLTPLQLSEFWAMKQSKQPDVAIASKSGLVGEQIEVFLQQVKGIVNQPLLLCEDRLQPGVEAALQQLVDHGAQLAVVTLRCQAQAVQILRQYNLDRYFRLIRGTHETEAAYQNYAICKQVLLQETMQALGLGPEQSMWMIGDTEADVFAAQGMKIQSIAVTCGMRNHAFLHSLQPTSIQANLTAAMQLLMERSVAP